MGILRRTISALLALVLGLTTVAIATAPPAAATFDNYLGSGGFGDFDGDNRTDLFVLGKGSRADGVYYDVNGAFDFRALSLADHDYQVLIGEFSGGDGRDDILLYRPGAGADLLLRGNANRGFTLLPRTINGSYTPVVADFDGNGLTDIFWYRPGPSADFVWFTDPAQSAGYRSITTQVVGTYVPVTGDFDRNNQDDILWYRPGTLSDFVWYGQGDFTFESVQTRINGSYEPIEGDFDGDGYGDVFWYAAGPSPDYTWYGQGGLTFFSKRSDVSGTYDVDSATINNGDGRTDIIWFRLDTSLFYVWYGEGNRTFTKTTWVLG